MFGNFIYLIVVLLIYTTYQPVEAVHFNPLETLLLFVGLILLFAGFVRMQFRGILRRVEQVSFSQLDHRFSAVETKLCVLAILLFVVDVYGLNLPTYLLSFPIFFHIPTLAALLFIFLFIFYLAIVWDAAYEVRRRIFSTDISRGAYIRSNISISVPVLIPWVVLSGVADIINILPFKLPKQILATTQGEIAYFLIFLLAVTIIGPALIQRVWRCRPLEPGENRSRIERLCRKTGLKYANILYWPIFSGRMITAGVMGLIRKFRYILVTRALLGLLEPDEIDSVIAHEIGHVKRKHLLFYLLFFAGYMVLSYASFDLIVFFILYAEPVYRFISQTHFSQGAVVSTLFSIISIILFLIYFRFVFGFFMRNFERQADIYVYSVFDSGRPLISTLKKIAVTSGQSPDKPNWHHFSIKERIDYLEKCETDRRWIRTHDRKVRRGIALYLVVILFLGVIGYNLNFGEAGKRLNTHFFEKILLREITQKPENANLYTLLGDLYQRKRAYPEAISAYEKSISLEAANPTALNNLAWLLATCEDKTLRDPGRALDLAIEAAQLQPLPHVLDTLAECYYVNGDYERAIWAEEQALQSASGSRTYYEDQLRKYKQALARSKGT